MRVLRPRLTSCSVVVLVLLGAHPFAAAAPRPLEVLDHGGTAGRTPTALASADFDEDGMPDLVVGYSSEYGGAIAVHRGNVDAVYPHAPAAQRRRAEGTFVDRPFLPEPILVDLSFGPEFLGAGDFDNDGHQDLVVGMRGETSLEVLRGDGHGGLSASARIDLRGSLVALIVGDVNRADGVPDVVAAVSGAGGPALLIFESPAGVLDSDPEIVPLPAVPTLLTVARTRDSRLADIVAVAEDELFRVVGRDRLLAVDELVNGEVAPARLDRLSLPYAIESVAWGDFLAEPDPREELAVVTREGDLLFFDLARDENAAALKPLESDDARAPGSTVVPASISGQAQQDLLVLDADGGPVRVMSGLRRGDAPAESDRLPPAEIATLESWSYPEVIGRIRAVLPMRLNADARPDLVLLQEGLPGPTLAPTAPRAVITVNSNLDNTTAGDGRCTLREAINNANTNFDTTAGDCTAGAGLDTIAFAIAGGGSIASIAVAAPALPAITDSVVIDGTTQGCPAPPCIELNGAGAGAGVTGVRLTGAGGSTLRGLVINRFTGHGVYATTSGNIIEGNRVGTDSTGMAAQGNGSAGIRLNGTGATSNTIGGTAAAARNLVSGNTGSGIVLVDGPTLNTVLGNRVGIDAAGTSAIPNTNGIYSSGVGTSSNTIGGTAPGAGNVASGNSSRGIQLYMDSGGNTVQGNLVGVDPTGSTALGNGQSGIWAYQSSFNLIGGTAPGARNVVSGNTHYGISLEGSSGNTVSGNYVGTDVNGASAIGNLYSGILLYGASSNVVGGTTPEARNVVSGNIQSGIYLYGGSSGNTVSGNYVGIDAAGTSAIPNTNGIYSSGVGTSSNTIGGTAPGAGNVASGNSSRGIQLYMDSGGNTVQGNLVGVDPTGSTALGNGKSGIWAYQSSFNLIGGTVPGARNVVSGNVTYGIALEGSSGNTVSGNYVGTDATGATAIGNLYSGIFLYGASSNVVGGTTPEARNVVSGNVQDGILIANLSDDNDVLGNYVGVDAAGGTAVPNGLAGIELDHSSLCTIGGTTSGARNVASGNRYGILLDVDSDGNDVAGNWVGINATGTAAVPNLQVGIWVVGASGNTVGPGNVASGNYTIGNPDTGFGILLGTGADGNTIVGNYAGTDPTGTFAIGNARAGIRLQGASNNVVGGTTLETRNVSSGNGRNGVTLVTSADNNQVLGNYLGVDVTGSLAIPNGGDGAEIEDATGNTIGPGNVISGNAEVGVFLESSAVGNTVRGNYVGTDATGTTVIGNGRNGIQVGCAPSTSCGPVGAATSNVIGGTTPEARNVIAGSGGDGVFLMNASDDNVVQGNAIGTDATGVLNFGNSGHGVRVLDSTGVRIGGISAGEGNLIVNNGAAGVIVHGTSMDSPVLGNVIAGNALLGIDLGELDGVTPNDPGDADTGPNGMQNFPVLTSVQSSPSQVVLVEGVLDSTPASSFRIEFFSSGACDSTGYGEGRRFLGATDVVTDGAGAGFISVSLTAPVQAGEMVTATATSPTNCTSEFSACAVASCSSSAVFPQTVSASDKDRLTWGSPADVRWVKGDLFEVASYSTIADGELLAASGLDIAGDQPAPQYGFYYLVRPLICGSWQSSLGNEPGRDSSLP